MILGNANAPSELLVGEGQKFPILKHDVSMDVQEQANTPVPKQ